MKLERFDLSAERQRLRLNRRTIEFYEKPISILPRLHAICHCAGLPLSL